MVHLLTSADYRSMPWKNGGGRTTEIAVHPQGAALDAFAWRVSIAEVACDGPFSRFPGVDRVIVLLDGAGMHLRRKACDAAVTKPFAPLAFSGDEELDCTLVAGPVRDFNAMFRRDRWRGRVDVVRGEDANFEPVNFRLVYAATGEHECSIPGSEPMRLAPGDSLLVDCAAAGKGQALTLRPHPAAVALVVGIDCR